MNEVSDRLRRLVEAATEPPWSYEDKDPGDDQIATCLILPHQPRWTVSEECGFTEADARLIVLAPEMALLLAECVEALTVIRDARDGGGGRLISGWEAVAIANTALTRLESLTESGAVEPKTPRPPAPDLPAGGSE